MKRHLIIAILFFLKTLISVGQEFPGKMKIDIQDRLTKQLLVSTPFTVTLNSADKFAFVSDNQGAALTGDLKKGKYKVEVACDNYQTTYYDNIIVGEGKTAYLTFGLLPNRPLTKKERKLLGIK